MGRLLRRLVVMAALIFWQGGFTFYAAVVVPVGAEALQSHTMQGFITQQVSNWINVAAGAALAILAWDLIVVSDPRRWRRRLRWTAWLVALAALAVLLVLHLRLDELLNAERFQILDREGYRENHRVYLWISTLQWGAMVVWLCLTLSSWRSEDQIEVR
jgi:hypothetical protein